jgi:hypothetical protein
MICDQQRGRLGLLPLPVLNGERDGVRGGVQHERLCPSPQSSQPKSDIRPPKRIYSCPIWGLEAPVAAVARLGFVTKLYGKVAAVWVLTIAPLTVPQSCFRSSHFWNADRCHDRVIEHLSGTNIEDRDRNVIQHGSIDPNACVKADFPDSRPGQKD